MPNPERQAPVGKGANDTKKAAAALASFCKKYSVLIAAGVLCAAGSAVLNVIGPDYISDLTSVIQQGVSFAGIHIDMAEIGRIAMSLICIYSGSVVLNYVQGVLMNQVACKVGFGMRGEISRKINRIPLRYFDTHQHGDTLSRVTNDVDMISQALHMSVGMLVSAGATLIGCIVMMFITEWRMAITAILSSLIGFFGMSLIMGRSQKYFNARQQSLAEVNGHVEEYFAGQTVVRAYNAEQAGLRLFRRSNEALRQNTLKAEFLAGLMMPLMGFIGNFGYVAVCVAGAAMAYRGEISFSVVIAFMIYIRLFTSPLGQIGQGFSGLQSALAASERVAEFLGEEELPDESGVTAALETVRGDVAFAHLRFGYDKAAPVIRDFSAQIRAGETVAVVGPTGAGKTTVVNLLMRFYEPDGGAITVDGVSISNLRRENVHRLFGMVLQDTWLFEGTVRENLTYGKADVTDEQLMLVCTQCGLRHFIRTLPKGLDTVLDDSVSISAGQKQLLTIARAMIEDAPMLILDEATSAVDTRTEQKIQAAMRRLTEGRTSFVIAHRLSTIRDADKIIYMQDGDIREVGTHDELMASGGMYAELYNSQFEQSA